MIGIHWAFYEGFEHPYPVSPVIKRQVYHFWSCRGSRRNRGRLQRPRHCFFLWLGTLAPRDQHQLYVCAHWKFAPFCHLHFSKKISVNFFRNHFWEIFSGHVIFKNHKVLFKPVVFWLLQPLSYRVEYRACTWPTIFITDSKIKFSQLKKHVLE